MPLCFRAEYHIEIKLTRTIPGLIVLACLAVIFASCKVRPETAPKSNQQTNKDLHFTEAFRKTNGWVAGDGATSVPLSDGRVLWLFGDSHIDDYDAATRTIPCLFQVRNAAMLQDANSLGGWRTLLGKGPGNRSLFQHPTDLKLWFWPVSGFQQGNAVYVYLTCLRKTGEGTFGFEAVGHFWGKMKFPEMKVIEYIPLPEFNGIDFGCGFVNDKSGFTFAFGNKQTLTTSDVYVARFKTENPAGDWSYWDGKAWGANIGNAAVIAKGASTSVNVCRITNNFLLTTSSFSVACDQGNEILTSFSENPMGPFSPLKKIWTLDDTVEGHFPFFYLPVAHPEFINGKNELLVTYSINGYEPCLPACVNGRMNPDHYRPKAIRVPLEIIVPKLH